MVVMVAMETGAHASGVSAANGVNMNGAASNGASTNGMNAAAGAAIEIARYRAISEELIVWTVHAIRSPYAGRISCVVTKRCSLTAS